jgi:hypothetical protein
MLPQQIKASKDDFQNRHPCVTWKMQQEARISADRVKKNRIWNRGKYIFLIMGGGGGRSSTVSSLNHLRFDSSFLHLRHGRFLLSTFEKEMIRLITHNL